MQINPPYLLYLEFASPHTPRDPAMTRSQALMCADIWHSLKELLKFPLDQLHPETAISNGYPQYLQTARLISLREVEVVAQLLVHPPEKGGDIFNHVFLAITSELKAVLAGEGIRADFHGGDMGEQLYFTLAVRSEDQTHLCPTKSCDQLLTATMDMIFQSSSGLMPHPCSLRFTGFDLHLASAVGNNIEYQALAEHHFYMNENEALVQLLKKPSAHFDKTSAFEANLDRYFLQAAISPAYKVNEKVAETVTTPQLVWDTKDPAQTGRVLAIENRFIPLLEKLGFSQAEFLPFGHHQVVRLDHWDTSQHLLRPTETFAQVLAQLPHTAAEHSALYPFTNIQRKRMSHPAIGTTQASRVAEHAVFFHCQDLLPALFQMVVRRPESYDEAIVKAHQLDSYTIENGIYDASGKQLAYMGPAPQHLPGADPGVYVGLDAQLLRDPVMSQLYPGQLNQGSQQEVLMEGTMAYQQVAYYRDHQQMSTTGYIKFLQLVLIHHLDALIRQCPEKIRMADSAVLPDSPYQLRMDWALQHAGQAGTDRFHYRIPLNTPQEGLDSLELMPLVLFQNYMQAQEGVPMQLLSVDLLASATQQVIMAKRPITSQGQQYHYLANRDLMDDGFLAAFAAFEQKLAGQADFQINTLGLTPGPHLRILWAGDEMQGRGL